MNTIAANRRKFILKIMDVRDETHIIHSCYAAGWKKYLCHFPGSEEQLSVYQEMQLCDEK